MLTHQPHRPFCTKCNIALAKPNGKSKHGFKKWHKYCSSCANAAYNPKNGHLLNKHNCCEECGFVPVDMCQLDIMYVDGNKKNKEKSNIKTVCANCNRLLQKKLRERKSILDITVDADVTI
jgi:hypothetical protein